MHVILASSDGIIFGGMFCAVLAGVAGVLKARLVFVRVGLVLCVVVVCLGLASFGWKPLFGGTQTMESYFGATMISIGLLCAAIFGAIEEFFRPFTDGDGDQRRGFAVVQPQKDQ